MESYNWSSNEVTTSDPEVWNVSRGSSRLKPIVHPDIPMVRFVCEVIVSFPVAVLGIFGNILAFVVLCQQKKRLTTNVLLQVLAVADTLILISSILLRSMRYVGWQAYNDVYHYIFVSLYPCVYFFRLADTWITVIMTVDRYIAVCYPLQAQRLCTLRRTYVIIGVILLATFVFSMPRFFEFRLIDFSVSRTGFVHTSLVSSRTYTLVYRIILFFIVMYLVPMSALIVLNVRLLYSLRRAYSKRDAMLTNDGGAHNGNDDRINASRSSRGVTLIVIAVVIICVVSNVITMTTHVIWALQMCFIELRYLETRRRFLANVSNVMVTFSCAINFVVYCLFSRNFRSWIKQRLCCTRLHWVTSRWRSSCRSCSSSTGNATNSSLLRSQERTPLRQISGTISTSMTTTK